MGAGGGEHGLTPQGVRPQSDVMGSTDGDPQLPHCWSITHPDPSTSPAGIQVTSVGGWPSHSGRKQGTPRGGWLLALFPGL